MEDDSASYLSSDVSVTSFDSDSELRTMSFTEFEVTPHDLSHVDIQGIPWRLSETSRENFRRNRYLASRLHHKQDMRARLAEYADFERRQGVSVYRGGPGRPGKTGLYSFQMMNRMDSCTINHFQLRHLLSVPSSRAVLFPHLNRVKRWDPTTGKSDLAVEYQEATLPTISTLKATREYAVIGGVGGELCVVPADKKKAKWSCLVSQDTDNIVTHIATLPEDERTLVVSSNDSLVRLFSLDALRLTRSFRMDWSVNAATVCPGQSLVCIVGDSHEGVLHDMRSNVRAGQLYGHVNNVFACSWSPDGRWIATGSQDHTCRIFDSRNPLKPFAVLQSEMAAVRGVEFSSDNACFAMMEADDYVHLYDVKSDFQRRQTIDFFGETAGVGFSPDAQHFYVGIAGLERGGIFEYKRLHSLAYKKYRSIIL